MSTEEQEAQAVLDGLNPPWHVFEGEYVTTVSISAVQPHNFTFAVTLVNANGIVWVTAIMPHQDSYVNNLMEAYGPTIGPCRFASPYDVCIQFVAIKEVEGRKGGGFLSVADLTAPAYTTRHGYFTLKGDPSLRPNGFR